MGEMRQKQAQREALRGEGRLWPIQRPRSAKEAMALAEILEDPLEEVEAMIRSELRPEADEAQRFSLGALFAAEHEIMGNEDGYSFTELDEHSPLSDPDARPHRTQGWPANDFDAHEDQAGSEPTADIVIDEFGHVRIPLEEVLDRYFGPVEAKEGQLPLPPNIRRAFLKALMLRRIGEALVNSNRDAILGGEGDPGKIRLTPLTQKDLMAPLGIENKSMRSRLADRYVKTPHWGLVHLSVFFRARWWEVPIQNIRDWLRGEDVANPYQNDLLYKRLKKAAPRPYKDNRQLRNILREAGIPLRRPRLEIYERTEAWVKNHGGPKCVRLSSIPKIREELVNKHSLFSKGQGRQCREPQYQAFVEERIAAVLRRLGVEVVCRGEDGAWDGQ